MESGILPVTRTEIVEILAGAVFTMILSGRFPRGRKKPDVKCQPRQRANVATT